METTDCRRLLCLAAIAAALAITGCGGGGTHAAAGPAQARAHTPTKVAYLERLDALCADRRRAIDRISTFQTPADYARSGRELVEVERKFRGALGRLAPPAEHSAVDRAVARYDAYRRLLGAAVDAARRDNPSARTLIRKAQRALDAAGDIIHGYGSTC
jgi:hypothetical protein